MDDVDAYFVPVAGGLQPVPAARSPWAEDMLHGRLLAGLAARAAEAAVDADHVRLARLTLDMFRVPPMHPYDVAVRPTRDGRRVKVLEISITCESREVACASALLLRPSEHPNGAPWQAPRWDAPHPDDLPPPDEAMAPGGWDIRVLSEGGFWSSVRKQVWVRDTWALVAGEPMTPTVRAAVAADLPNPLANASSDGLQFINGDLTLYLARLPRSEWIGLEVADHVGDGGIAIGACTLYDGDGAIGTSTVSAITNAPLDLTS
jgi:hypothetical protein